MRTATKEHLSNASPTGRRDPKDKTELRAYVHRRDVILKMTGIRQGPGNSGAVRGEIRGFTHQSRRRLTHLARNTADLWTGFLTVTYPADFPTNGREVKRHLNSLCSWLRRRRVAYIWILEFQERGAPHFHFLISGWLDKKEVAHRWAAIVNPIFPSEREKLLTAGTRIEAVKNPDQVGGYLSTYMAKIEQKKVPAGYKSVGRFWGASRNVQRLLSEMGAKTAGADLALTWKSAVTRARAASAAARAERAGSERAVSSLRVAVWAGAACRSDLDAARASLYESVVKAQAAHAGELIACMVYREREKVMSEKLNPKTLYRSKGLYADASRALRVMRKWYAGHCKSGARGIGFKWKWRGQGFILCDGTNLFNSLLRQSVLLDSGRDLWKEWDGKKDAAPVFVTPSQRLDLQGQMLINGDVEKLYPNGDFK